MIERLSFQQISAVFLFTGKTVKLDNIILPFDLLSLFSQQRGIAIDGASYGAAGKLTLSSLESHHPGGGRVTLDSDGFLHWPVLFLYPEHTETDFIASFDEQTRSVNLFGSVFGQFR